MRTLLLIEDDFSVRRLIRRMLQGMNFAIREVSDGVAALQAISEQPPDLIILDLLIPKLNGLQLLDTLKAHPTARHIPSIVITGTITPEGVVRDKGARGVLRKPFGAAELRGAVEAVLRRGTLNQERPKTGWFGRRSAPCILIVEDDSGVRQMLETVLHMDGYNTMSATNGVEALERMRRKKPCTILLDLMMPTMDGWQFRRRQLTEPSFAEVPVVCMTGHADPARVSHELGVPCLKKPLDVDELLSEIEQRCW
jgi:CheY-like chemotaxis protein